MTYKILLVDDEPEITDINKRYLQQAGYSVTVASDGRQALELFAKDQYALIISDIMMPNMDGYDFIGEVLLEKSDQPFLFITAKTSEPDKIYSLSLGADDYISKPFSPRELVLRVTNILHRIYGKAKQDLNLTNKAFDLLWILANHLNHVFSKTELYERVWEEEYLDDTNTLNVHIHSLRNDLARYSTDQTPTIKTVWGLGYKLEG